MREILIASTNKSKISEFRAMLEPLGIVVRSLLDFPGIPEVEEPFETFEENARTKAETIASILKVPVISDDSGLCVDALGGQPGVHSARWTGAHRNYREQNELLLEKMKGEQNRKASYKTVIALSEPGKITKFFPGEMELTVAECESETPGFSYDTVVKFNGDYVSEMSLEEKNLHSSRAKALAGLLEYLK